MVRRFFIPFVVLIAALVLPAAAHARVPAGFVGMTSEELGGFDTSDSYRSQALAAQRRAGVRLLRQTFEWAHIERETGGLYPLPRYDWILQDRLVLAAARAGVTVLPVLFKTPGFVSGRPAGSANNFSYPPSDPATMASFASEAVGRYGPGGSLWRENPGVRARPIRAWQVWNEPSVRAYWGGKPSAREYVKLLEAVNVAIKRRDRRAEVVTAGIPPSVLGGSVPIRKYIDQMYRAGAKSDFDTLAIHSYVRSAGELGRLLKSIRKIMNRHGDRRARIWITELGWCDKGPKHRFCVGARRQTALIRSSLQLIRKERKKLRLRGFVYFSWRDGRPYAPDFRDQWGLHTGLLKLNGKPKRSLRAFISLWLALSMALPASAGAALPAGFVGVTSEDTFVNDGSYQESMLAAQRRAGVRLIRQTFDWSQIEYRRGAYDWSLHDRLVLAAARKRITVLPILFNPPRWHSSRPSAGAARGTYPPRRPAAMARFAAAAVARYGPRGALWRANPGSAARPITAWQVWNEPSLPVYWGGRPSARAYVALLKGVGGAIKRRDRRAEVVTAGIPPSKLRGSVPIMSYIKQMYRAGGKRHFDTLALNSYARNATELGTLLRDVRSLMNRRGDRRARIWITELGWCDDGPRHRFCVGAGNQARLTRSSIALIRRNRIRLSLRGFVFYTWRDAAPYAPDYRDMWGLHTGLLGLHGAPKPAMAQFVKGVRALR